MPNSENNISNIKVQIDVIDKQLKECIPASSFLVQSVPLFEDEETFDLYCKQEDNIELAAMKLMEITSKQSKELFSRLKFHALELQTKLLFLTSLYELDDSSMLTPSHASASEAAATVSKEDLKTLKYDIAQKRSLMHKLIQDQTDDIHELEDYVSRQQSQLQELIVMHQQMDSLEQEIHQTRLSVLPSSSPLSFTLEEVKAILEHQSIQIHDLKSNMAHQEKILQESKDRYIKEEKILQEYRVQLEEAAQLLSKKKQEALQRDQQLEQLYHWYSEMTLLMQQILKCSISLESIPPYRLVLTMPKNDKNFNYFITLDERTGYPIRVESTFNDSDHYASLLKNSNGLAQLIHMIRKEFYCQ